MPLSIPNSIVNDTAANAVPVNDNFVAIQTQVNDQFINKDGSTAMDQPLILSSVAPSADNHAVRLVDLTGGGALALPPGMISDFGGVTAPTGWLLCDGGLYEQGDYASLYNVIGDRFATGGEGGTQFRVPDFSNRSAVGPGADVGATVGTAGGSAAPVVVSHAHGAGSFNTNIVHDHGDSFTIVGGGGSHSHSDTFSIPDHGHTASSGNDSHNHGLKESTVSASTGAYQKTNLAAGSTFSNDTHSHTVTVNSQSMTLGGSVSTTNSGHNHTLTGAVTSTGTLNKTISGESDDANTGVTATDQNYHPYVVVTKIIRAV